jgi:hypothetical protein
MPRPKPEPSVKPKSPAPRTNALGKKKEKRKSRRLTQEEKEKYDALLAAIEGSFDMLLDVKEQLLRHDGVDPSLKENAAAKMALEKGYFRVLHLLLEDSRVDLMSNNFDWARKRFCCPIGSVEALVEAYRATPTADDNYALRLAASRGLIDHVKIFLEEKKVDPDARHGEALRLATRNGHLEVVKLLCADERVSLATKKAAYSEALGRQPEMKQWYLDQGIPLFDETMEEEEVKDAL